MITYHIHISILYTTLTSVSSNYYYFFFCILKNLMTLEFHSVSSKPCRKIFEFNPSKKFVDAVDGKACAPRYLPFSIFSKPFILNNISRLNVKDFLPSFHSRDNGHQIDRYKQSKQLSRITVSSWQFKASLIYNTQPLCASQPRFHFQTWK